MTASLFGVYSTQQFTDNGDPLVGGRLYTYTQGTTTNKTAYTDFAGTIAHTYTSDGAGGSYIALNSRGELPAPLFGTVGAYDIVLKRSDGSTIWTRRADPIGDGSVADAVNAITAVDVTGLIDGSVIFARGRSAAGDGGGGWFRYVSGSAQATDSGLVFAPSVGSGRLFRDGWTVLGFNGTILDRWFGTKGDGVTNDSTAMKAFWDACISTGSKGFIMPGSYLITPGVLSFDNGFVDKKAPIIDTAGHSAVTFKLADATNSPIISYTNGTATSGVSNTWNGGYIGGITFDQNGKATAAGQHGINLRGVFKMNFGHMVGQSLGGSLIHIEALLFGGTNPDPYQVAFCTFEGVEANFCKGWAFQNENYVGLNFCVIQNLRAIQCESGGFFGFGAANTVLNASIGSCKGWAFDDGTHNAATGGSPSRFTVFGAELDDVENGIRLNRTSISGFRNIRMVHRFNFTSLNPSGGYWPRTAVLVAGGTSPNVADIESNIVHRVEAGGTKPDMGVFANFSSNGNITGFKLDQRIIDNAGFGFTDGDLFTGVNAATTIQLTNTLKVINDTLIKVGSLVRGAAGTAVGTTYNTIAAKLIYATELSDRGGYYDTTNGWFVVPFSGLYRVSGRITLTPNAAATQIQVGFAEATGGVYTAAVLSKKHTFTAGLGETTFDVDGVVSLTAGRQLFLIAAQNGGSSNLSTPISATADLTWSVEAL